MPLFTGTQTVDGADDEFCDVPPLTFPLASAPWVSWDYDANLPATVTIRVAWSTEAIHLHVHVEDPAIYVDHGDELWDGDNVQIFVAGTSNLTGEYTGTEDGGATHILIAPPGNGEPARAVELFVPSDDWPFTVGLPSEYYAARTVADGYDVELRLPWSEYADDLSSGDRVGFNLIVGAQDTPGAGLQLEGGLANSFVGGWSPCTDWLHPSCDDRTWCLPTLE